MLFHRCFRPIFIFIQSLLGRLAGDLKQSNVLSAIWDHSTDSACTYLLQTLCASSSDIQVFSQYLEGQPSTSLAHFRLLSSNLIGGYKGLAGTVPTVSVRTCALKMEAKFSSETLVTRHETTMRYNFKGLVILHRQAVHNSTAFSHR